MHNVLRKCDFCCVMSAEVFCELSALLSVYYFTLYSKEWNLRRNKGVWLGETENVKRERPTVWNQVAAAFQSFQMGSPPP